MKGCAGFMIAIRCALFGRPKDVCSATPEFLLSSCFAVPNVCVWGGGGLLASDMLCLSCLMTN